MTDLVADAYATIPELRLFVRDAATSDAQDPDASIKLLALEASARAIDRACNRRFAVTAGSPTARVFTPPAIVTQAFTGLPNPLAYITSRFPYAWVGHYVMPIDDVADTTGITVAFDSTGNGSYTNAVTTFRVGPTNNPTRGLPYTELIFDSGVVPPIYDEAVQVTVKWGFGTAIPSTIKMANLLQAARFLKRRDAPFGVAGSPDIGSEVRLLAKLDPDVAVMVSAFRRNWGAA